MKTLYRVMPLCILCWTLLAVHSPSRAQESATPHLVQPAPSFFDPGLLEFVKVFGLGGMIFTIWLFDYRRQRSMESIIEQYDKSVKDNAKRFDDTQLAHLAAFKDINERNMTAFKESMNAIQKVAEDAKGTAILCAQVNSQVAAKLEFLTRERAS